MRIEVGDSGVEKVHALEHGGDYHGEEGVKGPFLGKRPHHWAGNN